MFVKLNRNFSNFQYSEGEEAISYGGVIKYLYLKDINQNLFNVVPQQYRDAFSLSLMKISGEVPPHTDSDAKTVINFYVKAGNYKTVFFTGSSPTYQVKNQTNGQVYIRDQLSEAGSFVAKDDDAFCLDVEKTHAVDSLDDNPTERIAICLSTGAYNFEQVSNMLADNKAIH
jgi:hypothetical protein